MKCAYILTGSLLSGVIAGPAAAQLPFPPGPATIHDALTINMLQRDVLFRSLKKEPVQLFGWSIGADDGVLLVGAPEQTSEDGVRRTGAVHVYVQEEPGEWIRAQLITPSDPAENDRFGFDIAVDQDAAIIATLARGAFIFRRDESGQWSQDQFLGPIDAPFAGPTVAIRGDTAVVSMGDDPWPDTSFFVVFERNSEGEWIEAGRLDDGGDYFSNDPTVGIGDGVIVIGDPFNDDISPQAGAAFVFERNEVGQWLQTDILHPDNTAPYLRFGRAVDIDGDTLVISAPGEDLGDDEVTPGVIYSFSRNASGNWMQQQKFEREIDFFYTALDRIPLGSDLILSGERLFAASNGFVRLGLFGGGIKVPAGTVHTFERDGNGPWRYTARAAPLGGTPESFAGGSFAQDIAVLGDTAFVSAPHRVFSFLLANGYVFVYDLEPADINDDGVIDGVDLAALLGQWGTDGDADLNSDGVVNVFDLSAFLGVYPAP